MANHDGRTPLWIAAFYGHAEVVEELLRVGCDIDTAILANASRSNQEMQGRPPLFAAAENGHLQVVEAPVEGGCVMNTVEVNGRTPLFIAAYFGYAGVAEALIKGGWRVEEKDDEGRGDVDEKHSDGDDTTVYVAAQ